MDGAGLEVDARGHLCPIPALRLRRALERLAEGEVATLLADDPMARIDVPHFAAEQGHAVVSLVEAAGLLRISVRKGRGGRGIQGAADS